MESSCKRCKWPEDKQSRPGLVCGSCDSFVHLTCLSSQTTPGDFADDVFFNYTCVECNFGPSGQELFTRKKFTFTWLNVIYLTIHQLTTNAIGISNNGFFHYKTHIASFIDRNWQLLFEPHFKQKKNWIGTIAGQLSMNSGTYFRSGTLALGETGWWQLQHAFSPAVAALISTEISRDKPKGRNRPAQPPTERPAFIEKVVELGYEHLLREEPPPPPASPPTPPPVPNKRAKLEPESSQDYVFLPLEFDARSEDVMVQIPEHTARFDLALAPGYADYVTYETLDYTEAPSVARPPSAEPSESSSSTSVQKSAEYEFEYEQSNSPYQVLEELTFTDYEIKPNIDNIVIKKEKKKSTPKPPEFKKDSLFSSLPNSVDMPWMEDKVKVENSKDLVELSEYGEIQLLKQIDGLLNKVNDPNKKADLRRIRAKLALRRLKRHKHLPVFDFDKTVRVLAGYVMEDKKEVVNVERVLDRFQRSYLMDNLCGTVASSNYGTQLISYIEPTTFASPYSGAQLKPLVRRERNPKSLWLDVLDELLKKTNSKTPGYRPPPRAPLDYSYVRPQHLAAVNNLCAQFFWPGIDLSEALEYPEFSCVVSYKRVVVACAFLVPDVRQSEAYISFILTRPEWRSGNIATFMLYHLLQTCAGKDVTLHVSPTNPAIFMYQKFGFKVEELVQDFYEKYYEADYKGCRHALFLRLRR